MAGGRAGVDRAIEILRDGVVRTMKLLGVSSLDELGPEHVVQLTRLTPVGRIPVDTPEAGSPAMAG
jgi:L-lactate dehydrogenase (cytochrome)